MTILGFASTVPRWSVVPRQAWCRGKIRVTARLNLATYLSLEAFSPEGNRCGGCATASLQGWLEAIFRAGEWLFALRYDSLKEPKRMDSEIVDLAEKIQDRIVKLRDSL